MADPAEEGVKVQPSLHAPAPSTRGRLARLYEVDVIRVITAVSVVAVHAVAFTIILAHTSTGQLLQSGVVSALHFTREIFLAISAFVLVYGYANRPFSNKAFWKKRGIGVLVPYVLWSIFYEFAQPQSPLPPGAWTLRTLGDLVTGSASFQLYYILLTIELYLILPWFLDFIKRASRHPWILLGCSLALQVLLMVLEYQFVQVAPFNRTPLGIFINLNQIRFLPLYQFYVVLGGVAALKITEIRAFLARFGALSIPALLLTLGVLWGNLFYQADITHMGIGYGISVFQPAMPFYAIAVCACLYWLTYRYAVRWAPKPPRGFQFWTVLSNASFGIYLLHAFILNKIMIFLVPSMPVGWFEPLRVLLTWIVAVSLTAGICSASLYAPILSRLIGHPCMSPHGATIEEWLAARILIPVRAVRTAYAAGTQAGRADSPVLVVSSSTREAARAQSTGPLAIPRLGIDSLEVSGAGGMLVPQTGIELSGAEEDAATR
jgi:probable poly-beta-1,6-N-acetyl-D-glucosamine export protein